MTDRLGGSLARRPLHFVWILDVSGSMAADGKIQALNVAVREAIPHIRDAAYANPGVQLLVRALAFGTTSQWVVADPVPIDELRWADVGVEDKGVTEMGLALHDVARAMRDLEEEDRGFAPALVLVSDGQPTDTADPGFADGLAELLETAWGSKAVRVAVGIGRDVDLAVLERFCGNTEMPVARAEDPEQLAAAIRWASTVAAGLASRPSKGTDGLEPTLPSPSDGPVW